MDTVERERQAKDAYRAIGHYVVTFSQMFAFMRGLMETRLKRDGDTLEPIQLAFSDASAYQLTNSYFAICDAAGKLDADERMICRALRTQVLGRIEQRNKIAHWDWIEGATHITAEAEEIAAPILMAIKAASRPHSRRLEVVTPARLDEWTGSLFELSLWVCEFGQLALDLYYPFARPGTVRVSDIFVLKGSGKKAKVLRDGPKAELMKYGP